MKQLCSVSIMCADWLNLERELEILDHSGADMIHCDVMDGHFVPNLMMPVDMINAIAAFSPLPLDVHLMADEPDYLISSMKLRPNDVVSIHYESSRHVERLVAMVRDRGALPFLAINPATPAEMLTEILPEISGVLVMTVNPGFAGQKMVPLAPGKIRRVRQLLESRGYSDMPIEADGNCSPENIRLFKASGASIYVLGTSAVYRKQSTVAEGLASVRAILGE